MIAITVLACAVFLLSIGAALLWGYSSKLRRKIRRLKKKYSKTPFERLLNTQADLDDKAAKRAVEKFTAAGGKLDDIVDGAPILLILLVYGRCDLAESFLVLGADPNTKTAEDVTSYFWLHSVQKKTDKQRRIMAMLVDKGADRHLVPRHYDNQEVKRKYDAGEYEIAAAISRTLDKAVNLETPLSD